MTDIGRPVARSFKPRRRGLSASRGAAYASAIASLGLDVEGPVLSFQDVFGGTGPVVLDIGFGAGEGLLAMLAARPSECVIGVEVHTTGLAAVMEHVVATGAANIRVVDGDAIDFVARVPPASLDEVRIWFPDPWPKQRQRHRRLVRPAVLAEIVDRLRVGGLLHLATDITDYSLQMQQVCGAEPRLTGGVVERPHWRPTTRFEARGAAEGRHAVDLIYTRVARAPAGARHTVVTEQREIHMSVEQSSRPTHGADVDRTEEWAELRNTHLRARADRPPSSARGVHHVALLSTNVEATIHFYQDVLEFPLIELFENRDYRGSTHFFFDLGHGNSLAFFDFPGLDLGPYAEVLGGLHHLAISVEPQRWELLKIKLAEQGIAAANISGTSLYLSGPDGERVELIADPLGEMYGHTVG